MSEDFTTLTSLAILKTDLDEGSRDYLDYLLSFVLYVLKKYTPDPVTDDNVSCFLLKEFGLRIPHRGCQLVLRRLVRKGFLKKESGVYRIAKDLPLVDFDLKRDNARRDISAVYARIIEFAKKQFNIEWSEADVSRALLAFLSQFGIEFLRAYVFKTALPNVPTTAPKDQFVAGSFITLLRQAADPLFESFVVLVKGQMYSNALVCPDLESLEKNFHGLTFYLDTALLLNYLGLQGKEDQTTAEELLTLTRKLKGTIAIFDHTLDEVRSILQNAERNIGNPDTRGRVIREIRKSDYKRSDLILLRENIEDRLKNLKIAILPTPPYKAEYQISETELEEAIKSKITYRNPEAIKFDINSLRSIYVLRYGKEPRRLEDARAVFVTTNSLLAKAAFEFGKNHNSTKEVSSVVTDYSLANVAWLKAPLGAPELPTKELLAACYAAMEPGKALLEKYLDQINTLKEKGSISTNDHALLRVSPLAIQELMNLTLGDEEALIGGSVQQILERVRSSLIEEKEGELAREREIRKSIVTERDKLATKEEKITSNIYWYSGKVASVFTYAIMIILAILLTGAAFLSSFLTSLSLINSKILAFFAYLIIVFGATWTVMHQWFGVSVVELSRRLEKRIHTLLFEVIKKKVLDDAKREK